MRYFPLFVDMEGQRILVVGGGEAAAQKVRLLARTPAAITLIARNALPELIDLARAGRLTNLARHFRPEDIDGQDLVYAATGNESVDGHVAATARGRGVPVNVVDAPEHCTFLTPAVVDRSPLVVAIGSEGAAPVLARSVRHRIEAMLPTRIGELAKQAGRLRARIRGAVPDVRLRRRLWQRLLSGPFAADVIGHEVRGLEALLESERDVLLPGCPDSGRVALVGAGPGDPDLLTLKALQALEAADVLVIDRLVSNAVLDRGRRDAERIFVGKAPGGPATSQHEINRILVREAGKGNFVVRLKGGDPLVFARASEEMSALRKAGIPFEVVPGITAAQGAAATLQLPLTERWRGRSFTLLTGATADGQLDHDWEALARGSDMFAVYMGVRSAGEIRRRLLAAGMSPETTVVIAENATTTNERALATTLAELDAAIRSELVSGPAILFFRAEVPELPRVRPVTTCRARLPDGAPLQAPLVLAAG